MSTSLARLLLIVGAVTATACGEPLTPWDADPPVLTSLSLSPATPLLYPGETVKVVVSARDQYQRLMEPGAIVFSSSDPAVATVSGAGIVVGAAVGSAIISAKATMGATTKTAATRANVRDYRNPDTSSGVLLVFGSQGWIPQTVDIDAGTLVEWAASGTGWGGAPTRTLWLMHADYSDLTELDMSSGIAQFTFDSPGTYRFCSRSCWDPPDFGVIRVH
jgi:plastocyanin